MRLLATLAEPRLTIAGFAALAMGTVATYNIVDAPAGTIVAPLAFLAVNLAAAIAVRPVLRRGGLGVFHLCLLALLLLAGYGRLVHFDGRVEVSQGTRMDPAEIVVERSGAWHPEAWRKLEFVQGGWQVDYAPQVRRTHTRSEVWLPGERTPLVVGDQEPLVLDGYRFYTTHNKGFAPLLEWQADGGEPIQGVVHMPGYPAFDWKQENTWTSPDGRTLKFWLRIEQKLPEDAAWTLDPRTVPSTLVVDVEGQRHELKPGAALQLAGATLRYERLLGWMGYKIFYDPTILPMLAVSLLGVLGLGWHLWGRSLRVLRVREELAA